MSGLSGAIRNIKRAEPLLVTPHVERYLDRVPDGVVWDDQAYEFWRDVTQKAMGNEDRSGRFGASSRGRCYRQQVFAFLGVPNEKIIGTDLKNLFNDGKWRHLRWQMMAWQAGAITDAEKHYSYPALRVSGRMDGYNAREHFGFELKGDRNWTRAMTDIPHDHNLQIHTMMLAADLDTFAYVIEDKASQNFREKVVHRDEDTIRVVKIELEHLNERIDNEQLPQVLPACKAKEGPYRTCAFAIFCLDTHRAGDPWPENV